MKKFLAVMVVCCLASLGCDETYKIGGPFHGQIGYDECGEDLDCRIGWYCKANDTATENMGQPTGLCVPGCYVLEDTDPYTGENTKSYDSCDPYEEGLYQCSVPQYDGDGYCDDVPQPAADDGKADDTDPGDGNQTLPPEDVVVVAIDVMACYEFSASTLEGQLELQDLMSADDLTDEDIDGLESDMLFGAISWSTAGNDGGMSSWGSEGDIAISYSDVDSTGCYSTSIEDPIYGRTVNVDMTEGLAEDGGWVGSKMKPVTVVVDSTTLNIADPAVMSYDDSVGWVVNY